MKHFKNQIYRYKRVKHFLTFRYVWIVGVMLSATSCQERGRFRLLSSDQTRVDFNNRIIEDDTFNILNFEYVYNGGGVAIADFNNDGLPDIYFTGNMVPNRLYLNRGNLEFEDVTGVAGVAAGNRWCSGVAVIDVNGDGLKDIYVCATTYADPSRRRNLLFVNQGMGDEGIPAFSEMAEAYGVADSSHSTAAAFIDYDRDGDMDLFVIANEMEEKKTPNVYRKAGEAAPERIDRLYRNDWDSLKGHPVFTNVSEEAGIVHDGYSLGVNVSDINLDGWSDLYVTNDYLSQDLVYINNGDGTFTNKAKEYFQHTSYSAMGNDVVDLNNDGLPDVIALDMMPEDNFRKKTMLMSNNYITYINNEKYDYQYQHVRNTFQANQGIDPTTGQPVFGDVALMSGMSSTDWSWAPLVADFDQDGLRDIIITNGFPKDITDRDFSDYNVDVGRYASRDMLLTKIPSVKLKNYAYKNLGQNRFEDVTDKWGVKLPSFSNGATYADLDNDGDLDYVVNNINDPAFIYQNLTNDQGTKTANWLRVQLNGSINNPSGMGTKIWLYTGDSLLYWDHSVYRGYLSSVEDVAHFGLGSNRVVDSIRVEWPLGQIQLFYDIPVNQLLTFSLKDARPTPDSGRGEPLKPLLQPITPSTLGNFVHEEIDFIDYNIQPLLLHKLSQYGPGIAVADINGDDLDDMYISGPTFKKGRFLIQQEDRSFAQVDLLPGEEGDDKQQEELGVLLFDADGDGDNDLYLVSGSAEFEAGHSAYTDRMFRNIDGRFVEDTTALPSFLVSGSCVRAADYDRDGDLDLFVGGRTYPHEYPRPVSSYVLRNESEKGAIRYVMDKEASAVFQDMGMVTDALWTDFDGDGWVDLVIAGEWMPVTFVKNNNGTLKDVTSTTGLADKRGWWNSLVAGDFDKDGDMDYIAGNLGTNTINQASDQYPLGIYAADFDGNGGLDAVPTVYLKDTDGRMKEFPYFGRGDITKQIVKLKGKYKSHSSFAQATIQDIFSSEELASAISFQANYMYTSYIENKGDGKFAITPLPTEVQIAPVYGMLVEDVDENGNPDVLMVGNDYSCEVLQGRFDAFRGMVLLGDGRGSFRPQSITRSGFVGPGDAKGLTYVLNPDGSMKVIATQNRDELKAYELPSSANARVLSLEDSDFAVIMHLEDGSQLRREVYFGHTFLSQSSRRIPIPTYVQKVEVITFGGERRTLDREQL